MILDGTKMFALGWALNSSGWLKEPIDKLSMNRLRGINKKLGGLKINFTEGQKWNEETKEYKENKSYMVVWLERGEDIKLINVNISGVE